MPGLVGLVLNNLYGFQIRKDIIDSYYCKSETWMKTENDENVLEYWKLSNGTYIVKMKKTMDWMMILIFKILYQRIWELIYIWELLY